MATRRYVWGIALCGMVYPAGLDSCRPPSVVPVPQSVWMGMLGMRHDAGVFFIDTWSLGTGPALQLAVYHRLPDYCLSVCEIHFENEGD